MFLWLYQTNLAAFWLWFLHQFPYSYLIQSTRSKYLTYGLSASIKAKFHGAKHHKRSHIYATVCVIAFEIIQLINPSVAS